MTADILNKEMTATASIKVSKEIESDCRLQ